MIDTKQELDEALMWEAIPVERWDEAYRLYALGEDAALEALLTQSPLATPVPSDDDEDEEFIGEDEDAWKLN